MCRAISLGGARGLHGQRLHLAGDHGKSLAGIAGARRLDRGIERQQVGLGGDLADHVGDRADTFDLLVQRHDGGAGLGAGGHRAADHGGGLADLAADLADRGGQLLGGAGDGLRDGQRLGGGGGGVLRGRAGAGGRCAHRVGGCRHRRGAVADLLQRGSRSRFRWSLPCRPAPRASRPRRCWRSASCSAASWLARTMCSLNTSTARAMSPSSSRWSWPGDLGRHVAGGEFGHRPGQRADRPDDRRHDDRQQDQHERRAEPPTIQ